MPARNASAISGKLSESAHTAVGSAAESGSTARRIDQRRERREARDRHDQHRLQHAPHQAGGAREPQHEPHADG